MNLSDVRREKLAARRRLRALLVERRLASGVERRLASVVERRLRQAEPSRGGSGSRLDQARMLSTGRMPTDS
jgi:hypothetical protein